jgi:hypothetical protein
VVCIRLCQSQSFSANLKVNVEVEELQAQLITAKAA